MVQLKWHGKVYNTHVLLSSIRNVLSLLLCDILSLLCANRVIQGSENNFSNLYCKSLQQLVVDHVHGHEHWTDAIVVCKVTHIADIWRQRMTPQCVTRLIVVVRPPCNDARVTCSFFESRGRQWRF